MMLWLPPLCFLAFALNEIANPRGAFLGRVLWKGDPGGVALTFDDGPHPEHTPQVFDILDRYSVKASFFVIGRQVRKHGHLVEEGARRGHLLGNHTQNHFRGMNFLPIARMRREIGDCQDELEQRIGYRPRFYRQPAGFRNPRIFGILRQYGLYLTGWQARAFDTQRRDADPIAAAILRRVRPGGVILLHDGSDSRNDDRKPTLKALPAIIQGLKDRGMEFYTLDRLFGMEKSL